MTRSTTRSAITEPTVAVVIASPCAAWAEACPSAEKLAGVAARIALAHGMAESGLMSGAAIELGVNLADDAAQQQLNRDWRRIDRPTNVLAFPAWESRTPVPPEAPILLGDVVLAFETVAREAEEQGKPIADHLSHLVVHGVLHLLGYDHLGEAEAVAMEALETTILAVVGVPDPYRGTI